MGYKPPFIKMFRFVLSFKETIRYIKRCRRDLITLLGEIDDEMSVEEIRDLVNEKITNIDILSNEIEQKAVKADSDFSDYLKEHTSQRPVNRVPITDHAIVRYLERGMGVDIEELMWNMVQEGDITFNKLKKQPNRRAIGFKSKDKDIKFVVYGKTIVTVIPSR